MVLPGYDTWKTGPYGRFELAKERRDEAYSDALSERDMSVVSLHKHRPAPTRIVLHLNGTRRELLASDRVTDIARIARATSKATGQAARLYCSGWDWPKSETAS